MLNDPTCFKAVYIVCGCTDLRSEMDQLAALVEAQTETILMYWTPFIFSVGDAQTIFHYRPNTNRPMMIYVQP